MRTVHRLLYADVLGAVTFVAVSFLSLFFFIDFVDELDDIGRGAYRVHHAALYCLLELPGRLYELLPIAVLIGTIYAMARLAQSSEFTILRTGGLGPGRALSLLAKLGLAFAVLTFVVGDYVGPYFDAKAQTLRATLRGSLSGGGGNSAWLKDRRTAAPGELPAGERTDSINVGNVRADGLLDDVRIYEFSDDGQLLARVAAEHAVVEDGAWRLKKVRLTRWQAAGGDGLPVDERRDELRWPTRLTPSVVGAAVSPLKSMSTVDLYRYMSHLSQNEQAAQRQEIQFWKKALYPLACLVMVGLALPFAYLHARAGGVSVKVFGGILLGISFVLLNNVSTHLGLLRDWTPWVAAAAPGAFYLLLSMAAFSWLVRYR
ncbi:LPS export ABC transporter permease LptG [Methylibium sp. Root1272]|uniref:LPS export ABC transporter permease LptG n=1 Tax=Methylibium sp. Root1272 TaxID=1736441 RepID=UPI0006F9951B|nr:LPS export ABC transporter permease LptG [Methylibium sp. Root1272]KQW76506.1 LPS export ABC transporter permease LptG [Methylibium sp. Root1272]